LKLDILDVTKQFITITGETIFYPQIEELFGFKFDGNPLNSKSIDQLHITEKFMLLKFIKRPAQINYSFYDQKLQGKIDNKILAPDSIETLINYGYAIINNKVISVNINDRELLEKTVKDHNLSDLLSLVALLKEKKLLEGESDNIISKLIQKPLSELSVKVDSAFIKELYPYQKEGVQWLLYCYLNRLGTILADDMGLGKTAQIIALIAECKARDILGNTIIVVPNTLIENWRREFDFFCPTIIPYFHKGSCRTGLSENLIKFDVVIIPYSILSNDIEMLSELKPDLLVFDEASLLKNPEAERTIASKRIVSRCTIAMTGTPLENSLMDLWSIVDLVFPGYLGEKDHFASRYIHKTIDETLKTDKSMLEKKIKQILLRRLKVDHLEDLPEKIDKPMPIAMYKNEKLKCETIINEIRANQNNQNVILKEIIRLQQYTAHPELLDPSDQMNLGRLIKASAKFTRLIELLEVIASRGEKVLIFANHIKMIDILIYAINEEFKIHTYNIDGRVAVDERQQQIDHFSANKGFSVLVLNPTTAGMGLNIISANHVIHYSRQWNPALEEQATARAYRNGQKKVVIVYYFYYVNSIEEKIDERLRLKRELSDQLIVVEELKPIDIMLDYIGN
jgi:SNF2 family DNA or RNA helicase